MVNLLTITDEMADEMEEDFDAVCASLERIINRQHERIVKLEMVAKALTDWWEAPGPSDNLHDDIVLFKEIAAMAKRALEPYRSMKP